MKLKISDSYIGQLLGILAAIFFAINLIVMNISLPELGVEVFLTVRYFFLALISTPQLVKNPNQLSTNKKELFYLIVIAILIGVMTFVGFSAFYYIPPVDESALFNAHPVFMVVIAPIFLKEKCTLYKNLITLFIIVAVMLVTQPEFIFGSLSTVTPMNRLIGSMLTLSAAFTLTIANAVIRHIKHVPMCVVNFYQGALNCAGFLLIFRENISTPSTTTEWLIILTCGIAGSLGRLLSSAAFQKGEAVIISAILPLELVFVTTLQILVLGIIPNYLTIIGVLLLMSSVILLALQVKVIKFFSKIFQKHNSEEKIPILKDDV